MPRLVALGRKQNFKNLAFAIDSTPHVHLLPESETTISSKCHRV
jgi:hypothetical protein